MGDELDLEYEGLDEVGMEEAVTDISSALFPESAGEEETEVKEEKKREVKEEPVKSVDKGEVEDKKSEKKEEGGEKPKTEEKDKKLEKDGEKETQSPAEKAKPKVEGPKAPKTWRADAVKEWDALPAAVKEEVLKREEDMFKGLENYKQDANIGKALKQVVQPHLGLLQQEKVEPIALINNLLRAHVILTHHSDAAQKQMVFQKLAEAYGVSLDPTQQVYQDPQMMDLKKDLARINSRLDINDNRAAETINQQNQQQLDAFIADPQNKYFDQVSQTMVQLLQTGRAKDLRDAYDQALWLDPQIRQTLIDEQTASKLELQRKEEEERVKAAQQASATVIRNRPKKDVSETTPVGTMDDTLRETLATIKFRT